MATTVAEGFAILKSNLEITGLQHATVSTRQQAVRKALDELDVKDTFLTGSYARHTMVAPLKEADVDVFAVLGKFYYDEARKRESPQAILLDWVKSVLRKTYPRTPDISRSGQAVTIRFTDFLVDVVPAFYRQGGGYLIPNSISKTWISTDPKKHVSIVSAANEAHGGDLVPLIKMIKAWNKTCGSPLRSFHLEVLALQILDGVIISNFPSGVRFFFDRGRSLIREKNPDPAGFSSDVGFYLNTQERIDNAASRFQIAYDRAIRAEAADAAGNPDDAFGHWHQVFGDYFPAFG